MIRVPLPVKSHKGTDILLLGPQPSQTRWAVSDVVLKPGNSIGHPCGDKLLMRKSVNAFEDAIILNIAKQQPSSI